MAEEDLPTFHSVLTVDIAERILHSARLSILSTPETAAEEGGLLFRVDAVLKTADCQFMEGEIYNVHFNRVDYRRFPSLN